jgi:gliding motility-associated-like protein
MRHLSFILLWMVATSLDAQNLVPNYSFEDYSICPNNFDQIAYAGSWFAGRRLDIGSSDLYNTCHAENVNNFMGSQKPKDGNGYAGVYGIVYIFLEDGITPDTATAHREYIETPLSGKLIAGKKYCLSFYVSLSDNSTAGIKDMGAVISDGAIFQDDYPTTVPPKDQNDTYSYIPLKPQVSGEEFLMDTVNWIEIKGAFIAKGNEHNLTIGNFKSIKHTPYTLLKDVGDVLAYYYIDMITLAECEPCDLKPIKFPADTTACNGMSVTLAFDATGHAVVWNTGETTSSIVVDTTGLYTVEITGKGCKENNEVKVQFYDCINFLPNVITPNNDGKNDYFVADGINKDKWLFKVFDRWGAEVYVNYQYDNTWNGSGLTSGTYYFYLLNQNNNKSFRGWVQVIFGEK